MRRRALKVIPMDTTRELTKRLPGYLPLGEISVPSKVTLKYDLLGHVHVAIPRSAEMRAKMAKPTVLQDFLDLAVASSDELEESAAKFATTWGRLGICRHLKRVGHSEQCEERLRTLGERVEDWLALAQAYRAIIKIAVALHAGKRGEAEDWEDAYPEFKGAGDAPVQTQRALIQLKCAVLLEEANVRPALTWTESEPRLAFASSGGLFGILTFELIQVVARAEYAICSACGRTYEPRRRPRADQNNFCNECTGPIATKRRVQRYRQRQRERN